MYNKWGGASASVVLDDQLDLDDSRSNVGSNVDIDRASVKSLQETQASWLLGAGEVQKKKGIDLGCVIINRRMCCLLFFFLLFCGFIAGLVCFIIFTLPHHHKPMPVADNYTQALNLALQFFDAQWSGKVSKGYNIAWRSDSALRDGLDTIVTPGPKKDLSGGFYDAGDNIKFIFAGLYAMTILSWGVIEYKQKYIAAKQYDKVRSTIRWGTDFMFKTFNYTVNTTNVAYIYAQGPPWLVWGYVGGNLVQIIDLDLYPDPDQILPPTTPSPNRNFLSTTYFSSQETSQLNEGAAVNDALMDGASDAFKNEDADNQDFVSTTYFLSQETLQLNEGTAASDALMDGASDAFKNEHADNSESATNGVPLRMNEDAKDHTEL